MKTHKKTAAAWLQLSLLILVMAVTACSSESAQSFIAAGKVAAAKKDHKAAAIQFKSALQLEPKSAEARLLLGKELLAVEDPAGAAEELAKALDNKAAAADVLPLLSSALVLSGDYKKLVGLYGDLTLEDKQAQAALKANVATAWGALGDKAKTEAAVAASLAAVPDFGPAQLLTARILAGQQKFDEATALVDKVLARDGQLYEAWLLRGEILHFAKNDAKAAEEAYRKALAIQPAYVPAHAAVISSRLRERDVAGAKAEADKLRAILPNHPLTLAVDAQLAYAEGQLPKARELVQRLLRTNPDHVGVLILAGAVEAGLGAVVQAEAYFAKAVQLSPANVVARRNQAEADIRLGQYEKALDVLKPLLNSNPPSTDALSLAGDAELRRGDAGAAEKYFILAAKLEPDNLRLQTAAALTRMWHGDAAGALSDLTALSAKSKETYADEAIFAARMKRGEFDAALTTLDAMDKKQPGKAANLELRGRVHLARDKLPEARKAFEAALKAEPTLFGAVSALANIDMKEGKPDQAVERLQAAVKANPRNSSALLALANLRARLDAPTAEVKKLLADAVAAAPGDVNARLALIDFNLRRRQLKDALAASQDALSAIPGDTRLLEAAGSAQMQGGDVEQAVTTLRRLVAAAPNSARAYMRLADVYTAAGKRDQAEVAVNKALELEPGLVSAQSALVELLSSSNRQKNALEYVRRIQARNPDQPVGYMLEAAFQRRNRNLEGAIAAYRNGLSKAPSTELAKGLFAALLGADKRAEADAFSASWLKKYPQDSGFEYTVAESQIARGDLVGAEGRLKRVIEANPYNAQALNNMAWVMISNNRPGALAYAQRANSVLPDQPALMDTLALALSAENQYPKALEVQKRAVELAPNDHLLRLNLARLAVKAGDKALAKQELQKLKELGAAYPNQEEVNKLLQGL